MIASETSATFPIALQRDVRTASIMRGRFTGVDLILWRGDDEQIRIWEDRSPHRSVRLSAGRNFGDSIQEAYHGWKFGKGGTVIDIPAENHAVREDISVRVFPCAVAAGVVWIAESGEPKPGRGFAPGSEDALLRPVYVNAPCTHVRQALPLGEGFRFWVTPCDDNLSLVMGYGTLGKGVSATDVVKRGNLLLNRMRRAIEAGRAQ